MIMQKRYCLVINGDRGPCQQARFSNGKKRWLPNSEALELLKLPVKERVYVK